MTRIESADMRFLREIDNCVQKTDRRSNKDIIIDSLDISNELAVLPHRKNSETCSQRMEGPIKLTQN
jgi:hypothetical protein